MNTPPKIGKSRQRPMLSREERIALEETVADNQAQVSGGKGLEDGVSAGRPDGAATRFAGGAPEQTRRIQKVLKESEPDSLSQQERAKKEKRLKELEDFFRKELVPRKWAQVMPGQKETQEPEFQKAISRMANFEMSPKFVNLTNEWRDIMRELGREDEADIDFLRP